MYFTVIQEPVCTASPMMSSWFSFLTWRSRHFTGKTTAARLFAEILFDAGLRKNNNFQECSGQGLKDAGIDDFKKKAASAMDGVLFMDEAYTLDPVGDKFKGAPIANEMLTLAENERDRLTFILAGYEDEMNDKLFAFNPGFKSRFIEVYFEDFDEEVRIEPCHPWLFIPSRSR